MLKKLKRLRKLTASALAVALAVSMGLSANVFADSAPDGDVQEPAVTEEPTAETEDPTVETEEPAETEDADNQPEIEAKPTGLTILTMAPFGGYVEPEGESAVTGFSGQALAARYSSASLENYELNSTINLKGSSDIFTWPSASPKVLTYDLLDGVTVNCIVSQGDLQVIQAQANYQSEDNFYVTISVADRSLNEAEPFALSVSLTVLDKDGNPVTGAETTVRGTFYGNNILPMHTMDDGAYLTSGDKALALADIPGVKVYIQDIHASTTVNMKNGQLYEVIQASTAAPGAEIAALYPQVTEVLTMKLSENLQGGNFYFDSPGAPYLIYGEASGGGLVRLAAMPGPVAYREKYYLSASELGGAIPNTYRVIYDKNADDASGNIPIDPNRYYPGQAATVLDVTDIDYDNGEQPLSRNEYYFKGWNTKQDGSGTVYTPPWAVLRDKLLMGGQDVTLYAMWGQITDVNEKPLVLKGGGSTSDMRLSPNSTIRFSLDTSYFEWYSVAPARLTTSILRQHSISIRKSTSKGSVVIQSVSLEDTDEGVDVVVQFGSMPSSQAVDFTIYLADNGSKTGVSARVTGTVTGTNTGNNGNNGNTGNTGGGGGSGGGGSGGGGGGGGSGGGGTSTVAKNPFGSKTASNPVDTKEAVAQTQAAVKGAVAQGKRAANIRVKNASNITAETMKAMADAAKKAGGAVKVQADSIVDNQVVVRIIIDPAKATKDLLLTGSSSSTQAKKVLAAFQNKYRNNVAVISLEQQGSFGQTVRMAVKMDFSNIDTDKLTFYTYDASTKKVTLIQSPNYKIDEKNGYVYFDTAYAGDIIISEGPLTEK